MDAELAQLCLELSCCPDQRRMPFASCLLLLRLGLDPAKLLPALRLHLRALASELPVEVCHRLSLEFAAAGLNQLATLLSERSRPTVAPPRFVGSGASEGLACEVPRTRLSDCDLWETSRQYYVQRGVGAWTSGDVPYRTSCSAFVAAAFAEVVAAFGADGQRFGYGDASSSTSEPMYVVDLGCGAGILGVHLASELHRRGDRRVCVVLADLDPSAALEQAALPLARELVRAGMLDVARLDATATDIGSGIELLLSGRVLRSPKRPVVVMAHYIYDSLPIDIFRVRLQGEVECTRHDAVEPIVVEALVPMRNHQGSKRARRCRVQTSKVAEKEGSGADIRQMRFEYQAVPADAYNGQSAYFDEPALQTLFEQLVENATQILTGGRAEGGRTAIYMPTGAARCIWSLHKMIAPPKACMLESTPSAFTPPPLLFLVGDKFVDVESAASLTEVSPNGQSLCKLPFFDVHGSCTDGPVSACVVLEPLIQMFASSPTSRDGSKMQVGVHQLGRTPAMANFDVVAFAVTAADGASKLGDRHDLFHETRRVFGVRLGVFGPSELEQLMACIHGSAQDVPLRLIVKALELSAYDWHEFSSLRWRLAKALPGASVPERASALDVAGRCFARRAVLNADQWTASCLDFARWLLAVGAAARALQALQVEFKGVGSEASATKSSEGELAPVANCTESALWSSAPSAVESERSFLAAICCLRLDPLQQNQRAVKMLHSAAACGHRGARRRLCRMTAPAQGQPPNRPSCVGLPR